MKKIDAFAGLVLTLLFIALVDAVEPSTSRQVGWQEWILGVWLGASLTMGNGYIFSRIRILMGE